MKGFAGRCCTAFSSWEAVGPLSAIATILTRIAVEIFQKLQGMFNPEIDRLRHLFFIISMSTIVRTVRCMIYVSMFECWVPILSNLIIIFDTNNRSYWRSRLNRRAEKKILQLNSPIIAVKQSERGID